MVLVSLFYLVSFSVSIISFSSCHSHICTLSLFLFLPLSIQLGLYRSLSSPSLSLGLYRCLSLSRSLSLSLGLYRCLSISLVLSQSLSVPIAVILGFSGCLTYYCVVTLITRDERCIKSILRTSNITSLCCICSFYCTIDI